MNLYKTLSTIKHNPHYLKRYISFITLCTQQNKTKNIDVVEKHHILPACGTMFPQYKSFKNNPWNLAILTPRQHFIAHHMLARCFGGGMWYAFNMMCNKTVSSRVYKVTSRVYEECKHNLSVLLANRKFTPETILKMSKAAKIRSNGKSNKHLANSVTGTIWIRHPIRQEYKRIDINEFNVYATEGWIKGRGNASQSSKEKMSLVRKGAKKTFSNEHKINIGKSSLGKVAVLDPVSGKRFKVDTSDPLYISGFYTPANKGYKHKEEALDKLKGWVVVKDMLGNTLRCRIDDPRYILKELTPVKNETVTCPHCGKEGAKNIMTRWHFDNCKYIKV